VLIANYDEEGLLTGWGSGFFVDEGIVITNRHVVEGSLYHRVFAMGSDGKIDVTCDRILSRSGIKINLEDDIAYLRAYIECPHGTVYFADDDPGTDEAISILGFPQKGKLKDSLELVQVTGTVTGKSDGPWLKTDAFLDFGNSGGPVLKGDEVVGVAVAKRIDENGDFVDGLFVPVSEVMRGLEHANDPSFGYTPQRMQNNPAYARPVPGRNATDAECKASMGNGAARADSGGCRCLAGYRKNPAGTKCVTTQTSSTSSASSSLSSGLRATRSARSSSSSSVSSRRQRVRPPVKIPRRAVRSVPRASLH
jgi:hypothetical protein